VTQTRENL